MATAPEPAFIRRFTVSERAIHWIHASVFFSLLVTGAVLYFPSLSVAIGRRPLVKDVHLWSALAWVVAVLVVVIVGDRRALRRVLREADRFDADDGRWLTGRRAPQGRFNAGQKVNLILTGVLSVLFVVSGLLLWLGERDTRFRLDGSIALHDGATLVSLFLLVGHLYLSLIHPSTRHALRGMTRGDVREDWAEKHHRKWVEAERDDRPV
ncbi:MAG TPA: cytochrome b/b6 domain-containing protein [Gaiellaceae bacterium]|nr:cytochrome b/b6 domain-containing protein [Gaiellaceae bacterium]